MRATFTAFMLAIASLAVLPACGVQNAIEERKAIAQAGFEFDHVRLERADVPFVSPDAGADLVIALRVSNPNDITARLDRLDYQVSLAGAPVGTGAFPGGFAVAAGETALLTLPLRLRYANLPDVALRALTERRAEVGVEAVSHISTPLGTLDYPVSLRRDLTF